MNFETIFWFKISLKANKLNVYKLIFPRNREIIFDKYVCGLENTPTE